MNYDDAYANAAYIPDADGFISRWTKEAADFRSALSAQGRCDLDVSYGPTERQVFDVFTPEVPCKGTFVFMHGGYWLRFDKSFWSHFAQGALDMGWRVVMPSYDLCPDVSISDITKQIASAIEKVGKMFDGTIVLAGHSAGGHLVARMGCHGILNEPTLDRVAHIAPISPVSDLRPLLHTTMNESFKLTELTACAESPALLAVRLKSVTIWVGADERPVFLDQAHWLGDAWRCDVQVLGGYHHFDVIDPLKSMGSEMLVNILGT